MSVTVRNSRGNDVVLLNPSERALKYSIEMKHKKALTNTGRRKMDKDGKQIRLTDEQLAYRAGYLAHQKDSNKAFMSKHPTYKRKANRH